MSFPKAFVEFIAVRVLELNKELCTKMGATKRSTLTAKEKDTQMQQAFTVILQRYAKKDDWKELKGDAGKLMNQWKQEKAAKKKMQLQILIEDAARLEIAELIRSGELELTDNSLTKPIGITPEG